MTFDSDNQMNIDDLKLFLDAFEKDKNLEVVLGSRFIGEGLDYTKKNMPIKKKVLLYGSIVLTKLISNIRITDTHNGYRVLKKETLKKINMSFDRFEHSSEILDIIQKKKIKFCEVPTKINYTSYSNKKGQSIFNSINILLKMIFR